MIRSVLRSHVAPPVSLTRNPLRVIGLFWVPGGAFNIFAIRNAGLAISQGIVASSIVMVSFIWGNIIFQETARSQQVAYLAVWIIMAGAAPSGV